MSLAAQVEYMIQRMLSLKEIRFRTSRSSGPGGQNVNKVESRVSLWVDIANSTVLSDEQKARLMERLESRLTSEGQLQIDCQTSRSQLANREEALERLAGILVKGLAKPRPRKATRPSKGAKERRLDSKQKNSKRKQARSSKFLQQYQ